jgi:hypothetical protein
VACNEHQAQQIVSDVVVEGGEIRILDGQHLAPQLLVLSLQQRVTAETVDGTPLRNRHEPRSRIARDSFVRPLRKGSDECVSRELLGEVDVAHDARQRAEQSGRFDPPDCFDCTARLSGAHVSWSP